MRRTAWAILPIAGCSALFVGAPGSLAYLSVASKFWWAFPLSASLVSVAVLLSATMFGRGQRDGQAAVTGAYLVLGPSVAAFNLFAVMSVGARPPAWEGYLLTLLLLGSAWIYIRLADEPERREGSPSVEPPFIFAEA